MKFLEGLFGVIAGLLALLVIGSFLLPSEQPVGRGLARLKALAEC